MLLAGCSTYTVEAITARMDGDTIRRIKHSIDNNMIIIYITEDPVFLLLFYTFD